MILHLMPTDEKFVSSYINFINSKFDLKQHQFLLVGNIIRDLNNIVNVEHITSYRKNIRKIYRYTKNCDKIIIHNLNNTDLSKLFFFQPWLLKRCYWVVWGADLYYYKNRPRNIKANIHEFFRKYVIKNMGGIITHVKGDYELAQQWYGAKGKYYYSFMYTSNLYYEYDLQQTQNPKDDRIYIQIGNSADPSNNHIEVLHKLEMYKVFNIEIICPLSYGDSEYRDNVIYEGEKIFGDKFNPIIEFLSFDNYLNLLSKVDIAIFNHKRQQAMGNITTLLGLGKKVYIREEITTWQFCINHDLKVYSVNSDFDVLLKEMDEGIKEKNIENIKMKFSEEKLVEDWKKIFCEDII